MKPTTYLGMALMSAALASCGNEAGMTPAWQDDPTAVKVEAAVGGLFATRSNPADDAKAAEFNAGDRISVSAGTQDAVVYTFDGKDWAPATENYLKWETERMDFKAFHPVTEGTDMERFTVPADQSSAEKIAAADYMTFSGAKEHAEGVSTAIRLERRMARVIVKIVKFNDEFDAPAVSALTVRSRKTIPAGDEFVDVTPFAGGTEGGKADAAYTALAAPAAGAADETFIRLTVGGKELTVKGIPALEAGQSYTFSLTVGKNTVQVGSVTVSPWTEKEITGGEAVTIEPGDFMLKDGSLIKPTDKDFEAKKQDVIGVVAFVYSDTRKPAEDSGVRTALEAKGVDTPHGLVLALKNAQNSEDVAWGPTDAAVSTVYEQLCQAYAGVDGCTVYTAIKGKENWETDYPAFKAVETFGEGTAAPEKTTGWYLPSLGEWMDIMSSEGIGNIGEVDSQVKNSTDSYIYLDGKASAAAANLNKCLEHIGGDSVDKFFTDTDMSEWYWSSSECSAGYAYDVGFNAGSLSFRNGDGNNKSYAGRVRCVLAF